MLTLSESDVLQALHPLQLVVQDGQWGMTFSAGQGPHPLDLWTWRLPLVLLASLLRYIKFCVCWNHILSLAKSMFLMLVPYLEFLNLTSVIL